MEPWFDQLLAAKYGGVIGGILGGVGGVLGACAGILAPKGKGRSFVLGSMILLFGISILSLVLGIIAVIFKQPYHVYYGLLLLGFIGSAVIGGNFFIVKKRYQEAELRKIDASSIKEG